MRCDAVRCDAMRCDAMRRDAVRCDAMRCDAMRCDAMRCDAMRCDAMRCGAIHRHIHIHIHMYITLIRPLALQGVGYFLFLSTQCFSYSAPIQAILELFLTRRPYWFLLRPSWSYSPFGIHSWSYMFQDPCSKQNPWETMCCRTPGKLCVACHLGNYVLHVIWETIYIFVTVRSYFGSRFRTICSS